MMFELIENNNILYMVYSILNSKKLEKISIIDLERMDILYKYVIIATALSKRHAKTSTEFLIKNLKTNGIYRSSLSGMDEGDWVMIDFGNVAIHIFTEKMRNFYSLDKMWIEEENCKLLNCKFE